MARSFRIYLRALISSRYVLNGFLLEKKSLRDIQDREEEQGF